MSNSLPSRPDLEWLKKTARQRLRSLRATKPQARLADAQFELAREYGFSSWRSLKAYVDRANAAPGGTSAMPDDAEVGAFLNAVGSGRIDEVRSSIGRTPRLVNAVGPHPFWGGRPQALHVAIETSRLDMFEFLLSAGADIDGSNDEYEQSSPLMLTFLWKQPVMGERLLALGAKVGLAEALLLADDARVASMLSGGDPAVPRYRPNGGSILAMARTPFAIDRLLELGAPRDLPDRWGSPPLDAISRLGRPGLPLVRHLMARGFEASAQEYARMGDRARLERLLISQPDRGDLDDAFRNAAAFGHHELAEWLLSRGANVSSRPADGGMTALHSAAWEGDMRMVKLLVAAGADLHARDREHGATPAKFARVSVTVTNNPDCAAIADYLEQVARERDTRD
jgi:ankyrin repeat protein